MAFHRNGGRIPFRLPARCPIDATNWAANHSRLFRSGNLCRHLLTLTRHELHAAPHPTSSHGVCHCRVHARCNPGGHRVLPFKDRARGVALLYAGNSIGSALCAPLSIGLESNFGWRWTFFDIAMLGVLWIPLWIVVSTYGRAQGAINSLGPPLRSITRSVPVSGLALARRKGVLRGTLLVAAAAPITLVMLIWAAKYLVHDYGVHQYDLGKYLWLPATMFGAGSLVFGELRARSARLRTNARPPRRLVILATVLACIIASAPASRSPTLSVVLGSISMMGAGGLYTLGTSDMLAHTPRDAVAAITGLTTVTQSVVYILASPIVGRIVEHFGNYDWVMVTAGVWVFPCVLVWLADASAKSRSNSIGHRSTPRR